MLVFLQSGQDSTGFNSIPSPMILGLWHRLRFDCFRFGSIRLQASCGPIRFDLVRDHRSFQFDSVRAHRLVWFCSGSQIGSVRFSVECQNDSIRFVTVAARALDCRPSVQVGPDLPKSPEAVSQAPHNPIWTTINWIPKYSKIEPSSR